jgi:hypothetical protein
MQKLSVKNLQEIIWSDNKKATKPTLQPAEQPKVVSSSMLGDNNINNYSLHHTFAEQYAGIF